MYEEITKQLAECLTYLKNAASLRPGAVVVMGCSTSEVAGGHIGHNSVPELGDALVFAVLIVVLLFKPAGLLGKPMHEKV